MSSSQKNKRILYLPHVHLFLLGLLLLPALFVPALFDFEFPFLGNSCDSQTFLRFLWQSLWCLSLLLRFSLTLIQLEFWLFTARLHCTSKSTCHWDIHAACSYEVHYVTNFVFFKNWKTNRFTDFCCSDRVFLHGHHPSLCFWFKQVFSSFRSYLACDNTLPVFVLHIVLRRTSVPDLWKFWTCPSGNVCVTVSYFIPSLK